MTTQEIISNEKQRMINSMAKIDSAIMTLGRCEKSRLLAIAKTHIETASLYLEKAESMCDSDTPNMNIKSYA